MIEIDEYSESLYLNIKKMPKTELHAHLNGSLSQNTLQKLIELKRKKCSVTDLSSLPCLSPKDFNQCFEVFSLIHTITDFPEAIYVATCDVIEDFYNDGVRYLELRTTPKETGAFMTQDIYIETVLKAIQDTTNGTCKGMCVKLLISIDRKRSLKTAEDTIEVVKKYVTDSSPIVGLDISGNPIGNDINAFLPLLEYAKKIGLKLSIHIAEMPDNYEEVHQLLKLHPDRLGHGTYLHPQKNGCYKNFELLNNLQIPLEICLTSNVISKTVSSYEDHHFQLFRGMKYPLALCTDDKGIFNTSLSKEYYLAHKHYSLTEDDLFNLSFASIDYIFADKNIKNELKTIWKQNC